MGDSEAKKKWMKENSKFIALKFMTRTESDLLEYLDSQGEPRATVIKKAIREYMQNHPGESR